MALSILDSRLQHVLKPPGFIHKERQDGTQEKFVESTSYIFHTLSWMGEVFSPKTIFRYIHLHLLGGLQVLVFKCIIHNGIGEIPPWAW